MDPEHELARRKKELEAAISKSCNKHRSSATWVRRLSFSLMTTALLCSLCAAIVGFAGKGSNASKWAGGLALFPPALAFIAVNLRLDARTFWHRRKGEALDALMKRLQFELPDSPSADQIAEVSKALTQLNASMEKEYEKFCAFNWNSLMSQNRG